TLSVFFFFQAEDGIRDFHVTGVQTCALPILVVGGRSLLAHAGFRYALYPRRGGRAPELESADHLAWMGRLLARLHGIGSRERFQIGRASCRERRKRWSQQVRRTKQETQIEVQ